MTALSSKSLGNRYRVITAALLGAKSADRNFLSRHLLPSVIVLFHPIFIPL
jgi:hypothetical protein